MSPEELMQRALDVARQGIEQGQSPFGCAIALGDRLLACRHNTVYSTTDITAHAEINALRTACLETDSIALEGCVVATTCEPCPMCMAALHWARVDTVYYGATIQDARLAGFNELQLPAAELLRLGDSPVNLVHGVYAKQCRELFQQWLQMPDARSY
jgi:tRNA(Arg) A34 adenosine deaminase TadA